MPHVRAHLFRFTVLLVGMRLISVEEPESDRVVEEPNVKVFSPSLNECRNKKGKKNKKTFVCVASDFYPDHVSVFWQVDGLDVKDGVAKDAAAVREGDHYRITSRLRVPLRDWFTPGKNFTCTVCFFNGTQTVNFSHWTVGIEGPGTSVIRGKYLRITHSAKASYAVLIVKSSMYGVFVVFVLWRLQGSSGKQDD